jgi:type IV pilus assembly protein PilY1
MQGQGKRTIVSAAVLVLAFLLTAPFARAGSDLDVFLAGQSVQPNVLLLFDNSGSMSDGIPYDGSVTYTGTYTATTVYDRCKTFNSNCTCRTTQTAWKVHTSSCGFVDANSDGQDDRAPSYVKVGNRRNFDALPNPPKLQVAKSVVDGLLQDPANAQVRFGLMVLNAGYLPSDYNSAAQTTTYHNDKTILKAAIGTDHTTLRGIVDGLTANAGTPLAPRLIAAAHYYKNDGYFTGADPVEYLCQRNYVVLMTDGRPQVEGNTAFGSCGSGFSNPYCGANASGSFDYIEDWLGAPYDKDSDGRDPDPGHASPPAGCTPNSSPDGEPCEYHNGGSDYLDDVAKVLLDNDLRPDMDGQQALITYTIGFTVGNGLLQRTAAHGGGTYHTANDADELADAFRATLNSIVSETESFVAPVVPVSQTTRTQSGDRLYIALFRPRDGALRWPGNLKKYQVSAEGQLLDANGAAATNAEGEIQPGAQSYWDTTPSGSAVSKGGVGEILLNRSTPRNIYTNISGADLTASGNAFTDANTALTTAMLGAASATERTQIIDYVHGVDVYDDDEDSNITEKRAWILGDTIHSVPLVINYSPTDALILVGANDGMLHAFDDVTGAEQWAYVPDDLVARLRELTPGVSGAHEFFVDSSPKLLTTSGGQKIVVFGFGRGGRAYYAIDVTDKDAPQFLWKVSSASAGFDELGEGWSEPAYIKTSGGVDALLIGGGYDPYFDDPSHITANPSGYGRAIFAINATTGALIQKIKPAGMDFAIPSNVAALDFNSDGKLDRAYVGDLGGQMWRIDSDLAATLLFASGGSRKIYYAPDVVRDRGFLSVFFGTGDRSNPLETSVVDRIYAVKDDGSSGLDESNLVDVTDTVEQNGSDEEATLKTDLQSSSGWFIALDQRPGEKVLASPSAFFSVFFSTFVPLSGVCNAGGDARVYELNYETGGIPDSKVVDPDGDGPDSAPTIARDDRFILIGKSIPTELTVTIQRAGSSGFVASSGNVDRLPLPELPNNVTPLSWRECSTGVPCR